MYVTDCVLSYIVPCSIIFIIYCILLPCIYHAHFTPDVADIWVSTPTEWQRNSCGRSLIMCLGHLWPSGWRAGFPNFKCYVYVCVYVSRSIMRIIENHIFVGESGVSFCMCSHSWLSLEYLCLCARMCFSESANKNDMLVLPWLVPLCSPASA